MVQALIPPIGAKTPPPCPNSKIRYGRIIFGAMVPLSGKTRSRLLAFGTARRRGWSQRLMRRAWLLMEQVYVGHELRALAPTLKGDLAAVKRFQLRPVRDADDGGRTEFRREEFHELVLAGGIERRCRFIEHDNVGPMEEDSREGQPLLLATGQYLVPRRLFIETGDQVTEASRVSIAFGGTSQLLLSTSISDAARSMAAGRADTTGMQRN